MNIEIHWVSKQICIVKVSMESGILETGTLSREEAKKIALEMMSTAQDLLCMD